MSAANVSAIGITAFSFSTAAKRSHIRRDRSVFRRYHRTLKTNARYLEQLQPNAALFIQFGRLFGSMQGLPACNISLL